MDLKINTIDPFFSGAVKEKTEQKETRAEMLARIDSFMSYTNTSTKENSNA